MPATVPNRPEEGLSSGLLSMSETLAGMIRAQDAGEDKRRFDTTFNEGKRQFDVSMGEQQRQFDLGSAQQQRQFDVSMGEQQFEFDSNDRFRRLNLNSLEEQGLLDRASAQKLALMGHAASTAQTQMNIEQSERENRRNNATTRRGQDIGQEESRAGRDAQMADVRADQRRWSDAAAQYAQRTGKKVGSDLSPQEQEQLALYMAEAMGYSDDYLTGEGHVPAWNEQVRNAFKQRAYQSFLQQPEMETEATRQTQAGLDAGPLYEFGKRQEMTGATYDDTMRGQSLLKADGYTYDRSTIYDLDNPATMDPRTGMPSISPEYVRRNHPEANLGQDGVRVLEQLDAVIDQRVSDSVGADQIALSRNIMQGRYNDDRKQFEAQITNELSRRLLGSETPKELHRTSLPLRAALVTAYTENAMRLWDYNQGLRSAAAIGLDENTWHQAYSRGDNFLDLQEAVANGISSGSTELPVSDSVNPNAKTESQRKPVNQADVTQRLGRVAPVTPVTPAPDPVYMPPPALLPLYPKGN